MGKNWKVKWGFEMIRWDQTSTEKERESAAAKALVNIEIPNKNSRSFV